MAEHAEQRKARAQVLVHCVRTPDVMGAAFAQAEQTGGVVDLAIEQDDRGNARIAQGPRRLHRGETL
ncbi:hypothetical protein D3C86_2026290 [compost metagenome]